MLWLVISVLVLTAGGILVRLQLARRREHVERAFGDVENLRQRRWKLVPDLVEVVQEHTNQEARLLTELTALRSRALSRPATPEQALELERVASRTLATILATAEAYADLKASDRFQQLQRLLADLEKRLSAARRAHGAAVARFDAAVETFPYSVVASLTGPSRIHGSGVEAAGGGRARSRRQRSAGA